MKNRLLCITLFIAILLLEPVYAQNVNSDSLTINEAVKLTLNNQPVITQALEQINVINAKVKGQKSSYYPTVEGDLSYTNIGPLITLAFPGMGTFDFNTANNYDMHVSAEQVLYDFGRRDASMDLIKSYKLSAEEKVNLIKSDLAYQTIQTFYTILFIEKSIDVKNEQIRTLNEHLDIAKKKAESGSSTDFDVLTTEVRVASAQNELIDLQNALAKGKIYLSSLIGNENSTQINLSGNFNITIPGIEESSLVSKAFSLRSEIKLARENENSAKLSINVAGLGDKPTLSLGLAYGLKNGYFPNLDVLRGNWAAGVSANIPIFNGNKTDAKKEEAEAELKSSTQEILIQERKIRLEVQTAVTDLKTSMDKLKTTEVQVKQATEAVSRAVVQYRDGVITNLDLIDAETALAEAKLLYLQVTYKNVVNKYALDKVVGETAW
ncbi:MAG: TolC family protein [Ignavibacteriaceae bacterium]|nr:TolC family protein [Ignavibacteriaceae bacterium]